jgi:hypothetical protein
MAMLASIVLILHCVYALPFMSRSSEQARTNTAMAKSFAWPKANSTSHYERRENGLLGAYVCDRVNWNKKEDGSGAPSDGKCQFYSQMNACINANDITPVKSFGM